MLTIGLCGGSGSGKGTVASLFQKKGFLVIDTDAVYHELISVSSECSLRLIEEFGEEITDSKKIIDRQKLAQIVFSDRDKLKALNTIAHHYVLKKVREIIKSADETKFRGAVVDAPLLFESGFDKECDYIICVTASDDLKILRIVQRDNISKENAMKRIQNQAPDHSIISKSDFFIDNNNSDMNGLDNQVEKIISKINANIK